MTTDEILARADLTVAQNKIKLAEDAAKLNPVGGGGIGGGTGGGTGGNP
jgi:hypothetical protein